MKKTVSVLTALCGAVGVIGMIESIANFSLFQTFLSAGLIWGAFNFYQDAKQSLQDGE